LKRRGERSIADMNIWLNPRFRFPLIARRVILTRFVPRRCSPGRSIDLSLGGFPRVPGALCIGACVGESCESVLARSIVELNSTDRWDSHHSVYSYRDIVHRLPPFARLIAAATAAVASDRRC